ncbi:response regulator transcription factor [Campylobacter geochelonis]|uniref:response regulator transcription factor n=1 Tax=Campylobacter geochelonis TaxID=1780362 RepID=UPI0007707A62|nr:response regulator transcription factor [Campylobacter geochelonis]CZE48113.1 DNA-binding response regulator [Campylobacter geochelonis]
MGLEELDVLYAEDEEDVACHVIDVLELCFKNVYHAKDGLELLELYEKHKPDILLLDVNMPRLSGLEALKRIRASDLTTPAVMLTAKNEQETLLLAVEQFITKYIIKPFDKDTLMQALKICDTQIQKSKSVKISSNLTFYPQKSCIVNQDESINLSKKELLMLEILVKNGSNISSYQEIINYVYDGDGSDNAVKILIKDLRKKLGSQTIKNISGIGYRLEKDL